MCKENRDVQMKFQKFILEMNFGFITVSDKLYLYRKVIRNNPKLVCKTKFGRKSCIKIFSIYDFDKIHILFNNLGLIFFLDWGWDISNLQRITIFICMIFFLNQKSIRFGRFLEKIEIEKDKSWSQNLWVY